ncbi:FHA domain-containing protein [Leifsonia shinshuensis]|uniref:FHA domain-containing protein n=1 Tax=Leifsonia shinshuensis TaxID=150026 RepID=UPI001F5095C0|nr:FHA domain-containing protein [Leifsonia shinshuensis]MCI0155551.1 FHA domain-containing protein [Leifsonia shinshuensis]
MAPGFTRYAPTAGPSRWLLIAGRRFVACVESTAADSIVEAVWWLADSDLATIESVVGAFPLAGPDSVRSFAVAELGEPNAQGEIVVTAVVRGSAALDIFSVGGARRFGSGGVQPWVLAEFRNVTGLALGGDDLPTAPVARLAVGSLPIGLGVVDGELLTWSSAPIERVERSAEPVVSVRAGDSGADDSPAGDASADETIIRDRPRSSSLFSRHDSRAELAESPEAEPVVQRVPVAHELPGAIDIEEPGTATEQPLTTGSRDTPGGRTGDGTSPRPSELAPVAPERAPLRFAVRVGPGDSFELDAPILVGRKPALPRVDSGVLPRLIAVPSPDQEVSSTHLRIEQSGDAVVVTDLRSTNGTVVVRPGGASARLRPGESTVVLPGSVVQIGDGNIIEITAVPADDPQGAPRPASGADRREEGRE